MGWFDGLLEVVGDVLPPPLGLAADAVGAVARAVTGDDDGADMEEVVAKIKGNPELQAQLIQAMAAKEIELARIKADTYKADLDAVQRQLEIVNTTYRAELSSSDPYARRWRPTYGYVVAGAWGLQALGIFAVFVGSIFLESPEKINALYKGLGLSIGALATQWGVALTVLGVNVSKRSRDKETATGTPPSSIAGPLVSAVAGKLVGK